MTGVPAAGQGGPVVVISHDTVGSVMASPAIRSFHLARLLAREFPVVLAVPPGSSLKRGPGFEVLPYASGETQALVSATQAARVVVVAGVAAAHLPALPAAGVPVVIDGYNPFQAETFYLQSGAESDQSAALTPAYLLGDFFLCASERQRDWWLGLLEANGRVNAYTYAEDPTLRRLVDVVPYGLPEAPPQATRHAVKGVLPGIGPADKVVLWGGGLWPWLDPLTAIRAVGTLRSERSDVRLLFPGTRHPNPGMAGIPTLREAAIALARDLGLLDVAVFFGDWVPYADWPNYLLESDAALTLHPRDTLEARLAFRTRVLDYLWAGLPAVAARGDVLADVLAEHGVGVVVEPGDVAATAGALRQVLEADRARLEPGFAAARRRFSWEAVVQPLLAFCRAPRLAPDKVARSQRLGNGYYLQRQAVLEQEVDRLRQSVAYYEHHRGVRLFRRLDPLVARLPWLRRRVNRA